jgi:cell division septal protein FtsQ
MEARREKNNQQEKVRPTRPARRYYERRTQRWRNGVALVLLLVSALFWIYLLFQSPYLAIHTLSFRGQVTLSETDLRARTAQFLRGSRYEIFSQQNIFLHNTTALAKSLARDVRVGSVQIKKRVGERQLIIDIEERVPTTLLETSTSAYALDQYGDALLVLTPPIPRTLTRIMDPRPRDVRLHERALTEKEEALLSFMKKNASTVAMTALMHNLPSPNAVTIETGEGWQIFLSLDDSVENQEKRFAVLLETRISESQRKNLEYIDLRFGERVFYK